MPIANRLRPAGAALALGLVSWLAGRASGAASPRPTGAADSATITHVLDLLRNADTTVCELAARSLTQGWGDYGAPVGSPLTRSVLRIGRRSETPAVVNAYRAAIRDPNTCVRDLAVQQVADHDSSSIGLFTSLSSDRDPALRASGVLGIGIVGSDRSLGLLKKTIADGDFRVRAMSAWALGQLDDGDAVPSLTNALKDDSADVRQLA